MKKIILIAIELILFFNLHTLEINDYQTEIMGIIPIGENDGELGKNSKKGFAFIRPGPIVIDIDGRIYIFDMLNFRINYYDKNLKYLDEMDFEKQMFIESNRYIYKAIIDNNKHIYAIAATGIGMRLIMFDVKNKSIKDLNIKHNDEVLRYRNFFVLKNDLLYYTETQTIIMTIIDGNTKITDQYYFAATEQKENIIHEIQNNDNFLTFLASNNTILYGNRLLSSRSYKFEKYLNYLQKILKVEK